MWASSLWRRSGPNRGYGHSGMTKKEYIKVPVHKSTVCPLVSECPLDNGLSFSQESFELHCMRIKKLVPMSTRKISRLSLHLSSYLGKRRETEP